MRNYLSLSFFLFAFLNLHGQKQAWIMKNGMQTYKDSIEFETNHWVIHLDDRSGRQSPDSFLKFIKVIESLEGVSAFHLGGDILYHTYEFSPQGISRKKKQWIIDFLKRSPFVLYLSRPVLGRNRTCMSPLIYYEFVYTNRMSQKQRYQFFTANGFRVFRTQNNQQVYYLIPNQKKQSKEFLQHYNRLASKKETRAINLEIIHVVELDVLELK
ncbi:hypothetical protein N9M15_03855 [Bacteroidia bacterium]|nr:hypothetical protein [Bacteroidia bacterium]